MELTKRFSPNELCRILGISKSTLFYWEAQQYIPKAHRSINIMRSRYWLEPEAKEIADYHYFRKITSKGFTCGGCPMPHA